MANEESYEGIHQRKEKADANLDQAKALQKIEGKQNQEIANYTDDRDLVNQLIGRMQVSHGFAKLATVGILSDLAYIKEHKLYKALEGKRLVFSDRTKVPTVGTWEGFCDVLGISKSKLDEDLKNLSTFGGEALEAMNKVGVGYKQMRLLRKLPEKDLTIIVNDVESSVGDKDAIIELIEDITIKHSREKETLQKQLEEADGEKTGKDDVIREKQEHITKLSKELNKYSTPSDEEQLKQNLESAVTHCETSIRLLGKAMNNIFYYAEGSDQLRMQPLNQFEFLLRELVDAGVKNELKFDAKKDFAPLMVMFEDFAPEDSKE